MELALKLFISGISLGWGTCLVYCSSLLAPYLASTRNGWKEGLIGSLIFSAGRLTAYVLLGALAGLSGKLFSSLYMNSNSKLPAYIQTVSGLLVLLLGITVLLGKDSPFKLCSYLNRYSGRSTLVLGLLVGLAPCAPLMGILVYITLKCNSMLDGIAYGFAFGLGTMLSPVVIVGIVSGFLPGKLSINPEVYTWFQRLCGAIIIYFSITMLAPLVLK